MSIADLSEYPMTFLDNVISRVDNPREYARFDDIVQKWYSDVSVFDIKFMDLNDFLTFIPPSSNHSSDQYCDHCFKVVAVLARDRGMATILWKRYIATKYGL